MEIYNETIRDLLEPNDEKGEEKKLDVKIAPEGGTHVPGASIVEVQSMDDVSGTSFRSAGTARFLTCHTGDELSCHGCN